MRNSSTAWAARWLTKGSPSITKRAISRACGPSLIQTGRGSGTGLLLLRWAEKDCHKRPSARVADADKIVRRVDDALHDALPDLDRRPEAGFRAGGAHGPPGETVGERHRDGADLALGLLGKAG